MGLPHPEIPVQMIVKGILTKVIKSKDLGSFQGRVWR